MSIAPGQVQHLNPTVRRNGVEPRTTHISEGQNGLYAMADGLIAIAVQGLGWHFVAVIVHREIRPLGHPVEEYLLSSKSYRPIPTGSSPWEVDRECLGRLRFGRGS